MNCNASIPIEHINPQKIVLPILDTFFNNNGRKLPKGINKKYISD